MSSTDPDRPEPQVDEQPPRAPGGPDASETESDVGAASEGSPVTPEGPLSAQQDKAEMPDDLQQPEPPDGAGSGAAAEPAESAEPAERDGDPAAEPAD